MLSRSPYNGRINPVSRAPDLVDWIAHQNPGRNDIGMATVRGGYVELEEQ